MSPPLTRGIDKATGRRRKVAIPGWLGLPLFRILRHGKLLRGTPLDPFGYQTERGQERGLISQYSNDLHFIVGQLTRDNLNTAVALAELPEQIRGFGPVKDANRAKADGLRAQLLEQFAHPVAVAMAAE
jgi:indolepyruvate ferredoxin oxidoreductase